MLFLCTCCTCGMKLRQGQCIGAEVDNPVYLNLSRERNMWPPPIFQGTEYSRLFVAGSCARPYCSMPSRLAHPKSLPHSFPHPIENTL
jgi:hypothetical protein